MEWELFVCTSSLQVFTEANGESAPPAGENVELQVQLLQFNWPQG